MNVIKHEMRFLFRMAVTIGLVTTALVGCTDSGIAVPTPSTSRSIASTSESGGVSYRSVLAVGEGTEWLSKSPLELNFSTLGSTPFLVVRTPCNAFSGPYQTDGGALEFDFDQTAMLCVEPFISQEQWTGAFIIAKPAMTYLGDQLTLSTPRASITFEATS